MPLYNPSGAAPDTFTPGSVLFRGVAATAEDNAHLFWDDANNRLGIGTTGPSAPIEAAASVSSAPVAILRNTNVAGVQAGLGLYTDHSNAAARNWGLGLDSLANGDCNLFVSATKGGNPFAGTLLLNITQTGIVNLYGNGATPSITVAGGTLQANNINVTNAFYFPNSDLLMWATPATLGNAQNAYTFADGAGSTLRQLKADSLLLAAASTDTDATPVKLLVKTLAATTLGAIIRGAALQSASLQEWQNSGGTPLTAIDQNGQFSVFAGLAEAVNVVVGSTTGTKIGTATTQKLGFWNKTPVVQPSAYTPTNVTTNRSYDANATSLDELADVLGTLIADLQSVGLVG